MTRKQLFAEHGVVVAQGLLVVVHFSITSIFCDRTRFARIVDLQQSYSFAKLPFRLVFGDDASRIVILAVAYERRRTGYWRDRQSEWSDESGSRKRYFNLPSSFGAMSAGHLSPGHLSDIGTRVEGDRPFVQSSIRLRE